MSEIHLRVQIPSDFKSTARARAEELVISTVDAIPYVQGVESVPSPERATPVWARHLTEDDEWVVRTALANVASDLERALAAIPPDDRQPARGAISDSIRRYRDVLDRIETS